MSKKTGGGWERGKERRKRKSMLFSSTPVILGGKVGQQYGDCKARAGMPEVLALGYRESQVYITN